MRFHPGTRRGRFRSNGLEGAGLRPALEDEAQPEELLSGASAAGVAEEEEAQRQRPGRPGSRRRGRPAPRARTRRRRRRSPTRGGAERPRRGSGPRRRPRRASRASRAAASRAGPGRFRTASRTMCARDSPTRRPRLPPPIRPRAESGASPAPRGSRPGGRSRPPLVPLARPHLPRSRGRSRAAPRARVEGGLLRLLPRRLPAASEPRRLCARRAGARVAPRSGERPVGRGHGLAGRRGEARPGLVRRRRRARDASFSSTREKAAGACAILLDLVRHWGPASAARVLDLHAERPWPRVVGFGLGGDETACPARDFRDVVSAGTESGPPPGRARGRVGRAGVGRRRLALPSSPCGSRTASGPSRIRPS